MYQNIHYYLPIIRFGCFMNNFIMDMNYCISAPILSSFINLFNALIIAPYHRIYLAPLASSGLMIK